jgi:predicted phosphodiesterase
MKKMSVVLTGMLFLSLEISYAMIQNSDFTFLVNSDIHQTEGISRKDCQLPSMLADIQNPANNTKAVLLAGDLTDNGSDPQFEAFSQKWMNPIKSLMPNQPHGGLYLCKGNHDEVSGKNTLELNYMKSEYGQGKRFYYSFDIEGVHFICCEKFPSKPLVPNCGCGVIDDVLSWLADDLAAVGKHTPVIIFFHYNLLDDVAGSFGVWCSITWGSWTLRSAPQAKKDFYDVINGYNIQGIFYGHWHFTYSALWQSSLCAHPATDPKYRVVDIGGSSDTSNNYYAFCKYHANTGTVDINFKDIHGNIIPWDTLLQPNLTEN